MANGVFDRWKLNFINNYMEKAIRKTGLIEDFTGELHEGKLARVPLAGSTNAHEGETFAYVRKGKNAHLVLLLLGGGLSWNETTARYDINPEAALGSKEPTLYNASADRMTEFSVFGLSKAPGILSMRADNPFRDWNMLVVNYVTADAHVGDKDFAYTDRDGKPQVLHHRGRRNLALAMEQCKHFFPTADKLLICGGSAGAFGTPAVTPELMAYYPDCTDVTVFSDSAVINCPYHNAAKNIWGASDELVDAIQTENLFADWAKRLYAIEGDRIRYLYSNTYRDYLFATFQNFIDSGEFSVNEELCNAFTERLKKHVLRLRADNPTMHFYISDQKPFVKGMPGTNHCILLTEGFLNHSIDGKTGAQWLHDATENRFNDIGMEMLAQ